MEAQYHPILELMPELLIAIAEYKRIPYDETMTGEQLTDIGCEYTKLGNSYHTKKCFELAINKNYPSAILCLGNYYLRVENNSTEFIRLYNMGLEHQMKDAPIALAEYYHSIDDIPNMVKYLKISVDEFNDSASIYNLIMHYNHENDEPNSIKYCNMLIEHNYKNGQFFMGQTFRQFTKYNEMIKHYKLFLEDIKDGEVNFYNDNISELENQAMFVIFHVFIANEIDLEEMQTYLHKFNITTDQLLGLLQFKINKTKIPYYSKIGECPICLEDNVNLKLYDCLGHYYCQMCTVKIEKCAICKCSRRSRC